MKRFTTELDKIDWGIAALSLLFIYYAVRRILWGIQFELNALVRDYALGQVAAGLVRLFEAYLMFPIILFCAVTGSYWVYGKISALRRRIRIGIFIVFLIMALIPVHLFYEPQSGFHRMMFGFEGTEF